MPLLNLDAGPARTPAAVRFRFTGKADGRVHFDRHQHLYAGDFRPPNKVAHLGRWIELRNANMSATGHIRTSQKRTSKTRYPSTADIDGTHGDVCNAPTTDS